jgi:DNA gyrase subunit A
MKLGNDDELTGLLRVDPASREKMLVLSEFGFGKRVDFSEFSSHGRGTGGQKIYTVSEKTGEIVGCVNVLDNEEIMCITSQGKSIKLKVDSIRVMGRSAQGVKILSINKPDFVIGVDRIVQEDALGREADGAASPPPDPAAADGDAEDETPPESGEEFGGGPFEEEPEASGEDAGNEQGDLFDEE